jgi:hypothetical protein
MYAGSQGSARVFFLSAGVWSAQSAILAPALIYGRVGSSLALNAAGDRLAVGAYLDIEQGVFNGAVYLYKRDGGGVWSLAQKVLPSDSVTDLARYFGTSVALSATGNTLVVGATLEATTGAWWSGTGRTSTHSGKLRHIGLALWRSSRPSYFILLLPLSLCLSLSSVRHFESDGTSYNQIGFKKIGSGDNTAQGHAIAISGDGTSVSGSSLSLSQTEGGVSCALSALLRAHPLCPCSF